MSLPVLVVDDNVDCCDTLTQCLKGLGYDADGVYTGIQALELARSEPYGLAILDFHMPNLSGAELYERLHQLQPGMVAILLTGQPDINAVFPSIQAGMLHVMAKPADFAELMPFLEKYAGKV